MFKIRSYRGFSGMLNTSPYSLTSYKQIWIESETSVADAWYKYCDTSENANVLIESSLPYLKFPYFYESDLYAKSQNFFTSSHSNIDDFARVGEAFPEYKIINDCVIIPRNLLWLPHFIKTLDTSGPPIAYLVGIGHIGGDQGLLSLLRKQGYADIKRIYSLE
jgi:hypothetical protein